GIDSRMEIKSIIVGVAIEVHMQLSGERLLLAGNEAEEREQEDRYGGFHAFCIPKIVPRWLWSVDPDCASLHQGKPSTTTPTFSNASPRDTSAWRGYTISVRRRVSFDSIGTRSPCCLRIGICCRMPFEMYPQAGLYIENTSRIGRVFSPSSPYAACFLS